MGQIKYKGMPFEISGDEPTPEEMTTIKDVYQGAQSGNPSTPPQRTIVDNPNEPVPLKVQPAGISNPEKSTAPPARKPPSVTEGIRTAASTAGSIAGGTLGAAIGGVPGMVVGSGAGAGAGTFAADAGINLASRLGADVQPIEMGDTLRRASLDTALNAGASMLPIAGNRVMNMGRTTVGKILGLTPEAGEEASRLSGTTGIRIAPTDIASPKGFAAVQSNVLAQMPFLGTANRALKATQADDIVNSASDTFGLLHPPISISDASSGLPKAMREMYGKVDAQIKNQYNQGLNMADGLPRDLPPVAPNGQRWYRLTYQETVPSKSGKSTTDVIRTSPPTQDPEQLQEFIKDKKLTGRPIVEYGDRERVGKAPTTFKPAGTLGTIAKVDNKPIIGKANDMVIQGERNLPKDKEGNLIGLNEYHKHPIIKTLDELTQLSQTGNTRQLFEGTMNKLAKVVDSTSPDDPIRNIGEDFMTFIRQQGPRMVQGNPEAANMLTAAGENFTNLQKNFNSATAKSMGKVSKNEFKPNVTPSAGSTTEDAPKILDAFLQGLDSPRRIMELKATTTPEAFQGAIRAHLDNAFEPVRKSLLNIAEGSSGPTSLLNPSREIIDPSSFGRALGLDNPEGPKYKALQAALQGTGLTMKTLEDLNAALNVTMQNMPKSVGAFMARRAVFAGSAVGAGAVGQTFNLEDWDSEKGIGSIVSLFALRGLGKMLTNPSNVRLLTKGLDPDISALQRRGIYVKLLNAFRQVGKEDSSTDQTVQ